MKILVGILMVAVVVLVILIDKPGSIPDSVVTVQTEPVRENIEAKTAAFFKERTPPADIDPAKAEREKTLEKLGFSPSNGHPISVQQHRQTNKVL